MPTAPPYAELHCLSNFSFLRGASHPEELVERAVELGYSALAITDECSLAGVVRAHIAAKQHGLKLIIGSEFKLEDGPRLIALAGGPEAYGNLCELITHGRRRADKGHYRLLREDLTQGLPGCLILLVPKNDVSTTDAEETEQAAWVAERFAGRAWIAVELHQGPDDARHLARLQRLGAENALPLVATGDVHMHRRDRCRLQDLLTALRLGLTLEAAGHALFPNAERHLRARSRLAQLYPPELLAESLEIAARCRFSLDEPEYRYPDDEVPEGETPAAYLRRLTEAGMRERWPAGASERVCRLIERELAIIAELNYEPYFLTVHDIVRYARGRGILCQGRGSAANSAVCYCLGITAVDPGTSETLFERFVSKERDEPPDIDVDFEHERREEVIQYIYQKYGRERAALAATVITYRRKSALRDTGRAFGLDADQLERLSKAVAWWDRGIPEARLREVGFDPANPRIQRIIELAYALLGFPRHLSQHVGGFVISRGPLNRLVPIENAAMAGRTVIQWDKNDLDALGLLKVDCLALGMLSAIHRAFDLIGRHRGRHIDLAGVPADDERVYAMIQKADTVGVFQIESRAQMSMLPRLRPANFYDLVIEVAIVRPGPIQGDMVHPYLRRRQKLEPVTYPSEAVRGVLERTLGVPIFQEQVIKLAMVAAGFSAGEADRLRRAMAAWGRSARLAPFERRLIEGMRERGYTEDFARRIFSQIMGFGEYGFPESHAASFALLAYVSAWLKCHEPAIFTCALLNSQPMGFYAPAQLIQDARRHGVEVRGVDVKHSAWESTLEAAPENALALRLGLHRIKGLSREAAKRIAAARRDRIFEDVPDLAQRAALTRRDLKTLADAGALADLAGHRHRARWEGLGSEPSLPLFETLNFDEPAPALRTPSEGEDLIADYASLGLTLGRHPLALLRERLTHMQCVRAEQLLQLTDGAFIRIAGLVISRQHPSTAGGTVFLTLEDETGSANIIVWQTLVERYRREVIQARLLEVRGQLQREGEVIHVVAKTLIAHDRLLGELVTRSRDFH